MNAPSRLASIRYSGQWVRRAVSAPGFSESGRSETAGTGSSVSFGGSVNSSRLALFMESDGTIQISQGEDRVKKLESKDVSRQGAKLAKQTKGLFSATLRALAALRETLHFFTASNSLKGK